VNLRLFQSQPRRLLLQPHTMDLISNGPRFTERWDG
jgi:hypothetical protein